MATQKNKIIGIDLGTTFSCVACIEGATPTVISNKEGNRTTPSIISFDKKGTGERKVGMGAKRQAITNPTNTIYSVKRFMGKPYNQVADIAKKMPYKVIKNNKENCVISIGDKQFTPQELSAMILQELKSTAEAYLGHEVTKAVITVPAYFNDQERQATKEAGQIAGLEVMRIINEPTAAALAHGLDKGKENMKIAVYDFGGGTFDISILEREDGVFEVKSTNGDVNLGGDDFDEVIIQHLIDTFKQQESIDLRKDVAAIQRLKEAAEKAKKELSSSHKTEINLPYITATQDGPKHLVLELTRSKFEQLVAHLIERSIEPCRKAVKASGFSIDEIDEVILVGGSTRIPKVQEEVAKFFKKEPSKNVNPDEAVAIGAAIQGGIIAGDIKGLVLLDVTPLSLGIETLGGVFTKLIEANTTIPTKKSQIFSTAEDNQPSVMITVCQGERPIAKDNKILGEFFLDVPPAPRGKPQIEVTFDIDTNGIVCVSAKDKDTGKVKDIRIEGSSSLSKEEIERMKKEATIHAEEDKKKEETITQLNKADNAIFQMEKSLKEDADNISEETKKELVEMLEKMKQAHKEKNIEKIEPLIKEFDTFWSKVMLEIITAKQKQTPEETTPENTPDNVTEAEFEEVKE